jgi:hypothetical protein
MRRRGFAVAALALPGFWAVAQEPAASGGFAGTWTGSWEGGGTGKFEVTLERGADGKMTGGVAVGTDQGDYTAKFKELLFDGPDMKAKYDFPLDPQAEVALAGKFGDASAEGTWSLQPQGQEQSFAGGTWKVAKK